MAALLRGIDGVWRPLPPTRSVSRSGATAGEFIVAGTVATVGRVPGDSGAMPRGPPGRLADVIDGNACLLPATRCAFHGWSGGERTHHRGQPVGQRAEASGLGHVPLDAYEQAYWAQREDVPRTA